MVVYHKLEKMQQEIFRKCIFGLATLANTCDNTKG